MLYDDFVFIDLATGTYCILSVVNYYVYNIRASLLLFLLLFLTNYYYRPVIELIMILVIYAVKQQQRIGVKFCTFKSNFN